MLQEFREFGKIARLNRTAVATEKLDGTNAQVVILSGAEAELYGGNHWLHYGEDTYIAAGSRTRFITPDNDNYGFARWVWEKADDLINLGTGHHFGEWWGAGIQRGYGLKNNDKRFSLFNVSRWTSDFNDTGIGVESTACIEVPCCHVVPKLWEGDFLNLESKLLIDLLREHGSYAVPNYMRPEGIVVFHTASNTLFKQTLEKDEVPKSKVYDR